MLRRTSNFSKYVYQKNINNIINGNTPSISLMSTQLKQPEMRVSAEDLLDLNRANDNFSGLAMSATLGINEMQNLIQSENRDVYKFGFGQSPMPVPQCLVNELIRYAQVKDYLPVQGLLQLRQSIATYFNENVLNIHPNIDPKNIIITPGTKQAFFLLKLALQSTCDILLPSPSWVTYNPQSQIIGRPVTWIDTSADTNWKIQPQALENSIKGQPAKQRLLILNSPSNPTGIKYTYSELAEIAEICRKYNIIVLSDEIYGDLYHDTENDSYFSMYDLYPENTLITNGLSKGLGAGGWRLGYMIFPENMKWLLDPVFIGSSETHTSVAAPVQYAACSAFDHYHSDELQQYLTVKRKILKGLAERFTNLLQDIEGCKVVKPNGGFYIFPDFSNVKNIENMRDKWSQKTGKNKEQWNGAEWAMFLLQETGVAGLAGTHFGRPSNELSMRLSYVDFDGSKLFDVNNSCDLNLVQNISTESPEMDIILHKYCYKTIEGMNVLYDYMSSL